MGPFSILLRWELTLPPWGRLFASRAQRQARVTVNYHFGKYFTNPGAESLKPRVAVTTQVTRRLSRDRDSRPPRPPSAHCTLHTGE
jgi:hypothetical protein